MQNNPGGTETTNFAADVRRLVVLALLTALAVLLCERWSEAARIDSTDRATRMTAVVGRVLKAPHAPHVRAR